MNLLGTVVRDINKVLVWTVNETPLVQNEHYRWWDALVTDFTSINSTLWQEFIA